MLQEFAREGAALRRQCRELISARSASWLNLGAGLSATALQHRLFAFVLDAVFALDMLSLPTQSQFDEAVALVKGEGLLRRAGLVLERVGTLVQQRRAVVTQIAQ